MENLQEVRWTRLSRNILFVIFDYLGTETVFLSIALTNKHFQKLAAGYIKVAGCLEILNKNHEYIMQFERVQHLKIIYNYYMPTELINIPMSVQYLCIYGSSTTGIKFFHDPMNLISLKYKVAQLDNFCKNIYLPSILNKSLKKMKVKRQTSIIADIEKLMYFNQLEEVSLFCGYNNEDLTQLFGDKLQKLFIVQISLFHNFPFHTTRFLKKLTAYFNNSLISVVQGLDYLENLCILRNPLCIFENIEKLLTNTEGKGLLKFRFTIYEENDIHILIEKILYSYPELLSLHVSVKISDLSLIPKIIELCLSHRKLQKFNGIPFREMENNQGKGIKLYENRDSSLQYSKNIDLSLGVIFYFKDKLSTLREIRIKKENNETSNIYVQKILEKAKKIGFFSNSLHFFPYSPEVLLVLLIWIRENFGRIGLRIDYMMGSPLFIRVLEDCKNLQSYVGISTPAILETLLSFPKLTYVKILTRNLEVDQIILNRNIKSLNVSDLRITQEKIEIWGQLIENLEHLENLVFNFVCNRSAIFFPVFESLKNLKKLKSLEISFGPHAFVLTEYEENSLFQTLETSIMHLTQLEEFSFYIIPHRLSIENYFSKIQQILALSASISTVYGKPRNCFTIEYFSEKFS